MLTQNGILHNRLINKNTKQVICFFKVVFHIFLVKKKKEREREKVTNSSQKKFTTLLLKREQKDVTRNKEKGRSFYLILIDEKWCVKKKSKPGVVYTNHKRKQLTRLPLPLPLLL